MGNSINVTQRVKINADPDVVADVLLDCEAYDVVQVTVPKNTTDLEVTLQPGAVADVQLFAIKSTGYSESGVNKMSYKVHDSGADPVVLDNAQVIAGAGAVALLGANLDKLYLSNTSSVNDYTVTIIVGRNATP